MYSLWNRFLGIFFSIVKISKNSHFQFNSSVKSDILISFHFSFLFSFFSKTSQKSIKQADVVVSSRRMGNETRWKNQNMEKKMVCFDPD